MTLRWKEFFGIPGNIDLDRLRKENKNTTPPRKATPKDELIGEEFQGIREAECARSVPKRIGRT